MYFRLSAQVTLLSRSLPADTDLFLSLYIHFLKGFEIKLSVHVCRKRWDGK